MGKFELDQLESRRLLSATGVGHNPISGLSPAQVLQAEKAENTAIKHQIHADQNTYTTQIGADQSAVDAARQAIWAGSTLKNKLTTDQRSAAQLIAADQTAIYTAATNGLPAITADLKQLEADKSNPTAHAADKAKLTADRGIYAAAVSAAVSKLQADQTSTQATLAADNAAKQAILQSSAAYTNAVAKLKADTDADNLAIDLDNVIAVAVNTLIHGSAVGPTPPINQTGTLALIGYNTDSIADRAEIDFIQAKLTADQNTQTSGQSADSAAIAAARLAVLAGTRDLALLKQYQSLKTQVFAADQKSLNAAVTTYLTQVIDDQEQTIADQTNPPAGALDADQTQLSADQAALQSAVLTAQARLEGDLSGYETAIAQTQSDIHSLIKNATAYVSVVAKQQADASADSNNIQSDQAILSAANAKFSADYFIHYYVGQSGGTLTLNGTNNYYGSTTIDAGNLIINNVGGGLTDAGITAIGGLLNVSSGGTPQTGVINNATGTVSLNKIGAGTLTLSGVSSFNNTLQYSGGTLQLNNTASNLTFGGGALQIGASFGTPSSLNRFITDNSSPNFVGPGQLNLSSSSVSSGGAIFNVSAVQNNALSAIPLGGTLTVSSSANVAALGLTFDDTNHTVTVAGIYASLKAGTLVNFNGATYTVAQAS